MIDVKLDKDNVERFHVEGATKDIITEATTMLGAIYLDVLEMAFNAEQLKDKPKPFIHKQIRKVFADEIATTMAAADSQTIDSYNTDETLKSLANFMKDLTEEQKKWGTQTGLKDLTTS